VETLAELIGDTPKVAFDHYGKQWSERYQEPLWAAIGVGLKGGNDRRAAAAFTETNVSGPAKKPKAAMPERSDDKGKKRRVKIRASKRQLPG
jgi:hypothetical protein